MGQLHQQAQLSHPALALSSPIGWDTILTLPAGAAYIRVFISTLPF